MKMLTGAHTLIFYPNYVLKPYFHSPTFVQMKTQKDEELELMKWEAGVGGRQIGEKGPEEAPDFGPDIDPEKEALAATRKKMAVAAPQLDPDVLENQNKMVPNPDFIPDSMLDPEEDPNDPDRAPEFISASNLSDYKIFISMYEKKLASRKKAKVKRDNDLEAWSKREVQAALDKKLLEQKIKAEAMYQVFPPFLNSKSSY